VAATGIGAGSPAHIFVLTIAKRDTHMQQRTILIDSSLTTKAVFGRRGHKLSLND
jgi:hypothetical protein